MYRNSTGLYSRHFYWKYSIMNMSLELWGISAVMKVMIASQESDFSYMGYK